MPYNPASNLISNLPQAQVIWYVKNFIQNLKANTPFLRMVTLLDMPLNSGNQLRLFMYPTLGSNTSQAGEGTVGTGFTITPLTSNATMGEYADFGNFSSFSMATAIDPLVENVSKELAYRLGQSISSLVRVQTDTLNTIDSSVKVLLAATSTTAFTALTNSQIRSSVMSLQGRSVPGLDGKEIYGGAIHPFVLGDVLADTANNSPLDILKHTSEGLKRLDDLGGIDEMEMVQFPSSSVAFAKTPLVTQTANYNPGAGAITGLTALRTYIYGKDALVGVKLGAQGDTDYGEGAWQNIQPVVVKNPPTSAADPEGLIAGWTSYKCHFTVSNIPDTTGRVRYIDGASGIS